MNTKSTFNSCLLKKIRSVFVFFVLINLISCSAEIRNETEKQESVNWDSKRINLDSVKNLTTGYSYLSVYSEIYDLTDESTHLLTATVSIRNTSERDSLFLTIADYYNTKGELIRSYLEHPVFLIPLETIEIVIPRRDMSGGTGANFVFHWGTKNPKYEPLFEAVMIWTTGTQGISFTTHGKNYTND